MEYIQPIMKRNYLFIFTIWFLSLQVITAQITEKQTIQLLQKIDESISKINTVVYKIDYKNKALSRRDTIHTTAVCSLYITRNDKMKSYNIVDLVFKELDYVTYGHRRYDGKRSLWMNCPLDSLGLAVKPDFDSKKRERQNVVENYSSVLLREYLMPDKPFGRYISAAGGINVKEETILNTPVYVLTIAFKDHDDIRDNVEKHYIRKSDYLPIAYFSFLKWENMEQYNYYEVDYLAINANIPKDSFTINKDEVVNAKERYNLFNKKIKAVDNGTK